MSGPTGIFLRVQGIDFGVYMAYVRDFCAGACPRLHTGFSVFLDRPGRTPSFRHSHLEA